jgi:hypothetical protein
MIDEQLNHESASHPAPLATGTVLEALERTCTTWLEANADRFDPFPDAGADLSTVSVRRKAFSELAILLYVRDRLGEERTVPRLRSLYVKRVNDPRYVELLRRHPERVLLYASALSTAHAGGLLHDDAHTALAAALDEPLVWNTERTPFRELDLWHVCQLSDQTKPAFDVNACVGRGCLGTPFDVVTASSSDVYALTHTVFYYYNFGVACPGFPTAPIPVAFDLERTISGLILRSVAKNDADLVLELLLAGTVSGQLCPEVRDVALRWVVASSTEGYVPGPSGTTCENASKDGDEEFRRWARHYHTNLVAAMTATVMRHAERTAPETVRSEQRVGAIATDELLALGELLESLHEYQLADAAVLLSSLADKPIAQEYSALLDAGASFLRRQEDGTGTFGFWADERVLFEANGGDPATFDERFLTPVSDACREALAKLETPANERDRHCPGGRDGRRGTAGQATHD